MKTMIINRVNGKNNTIYVPTDDVNANTFATNFLDGEFQVLKFASEAGSDVVASCYDVNLMFKNVASGMKSYMSMLVPVTKTEEDIFTVLKGLTINGILIDEVYIISMKKVIF